MRAYNLPGDLIGSSARGTHSFEVIAFAACLPLVVLR